MPVLLWYGNGEWEWFRDREWKGRVDMPRSGSGKARPRPRRKIGSNGKERYQGANPGELEAFLARDADAYLDYTFKLDRYPATVGSFNSLFHLAIWRVHRDTVWSFVLPRVLSGHWIELRFKGPHGPAPHRYLMTTKQFESLERWERYLLVEGIYPLPKKNPMAVKEAKTPIPHYFELAEEW